jgi:hypothetical protein
MMTKKARSPIVIPSKATTDGYWLGGVNRCRVEGPPQQANYLQKASRETRTIHNYDGKKTYRLDFNQQPYSATSLRMTRNENSTLAIPSKARTF